MRERGPVYVDVMVFCLIHGSAQGLAGWQLLIPELNRGGCDAFTVDLPIDEPDAGANWYADVIAAQIRAHEREDVIAVAHSASGLFLPLLPQRCAIQRLVFLSRQSPVANRRAALGSR